MGRLTACDRTFSIRATRPEYRSSFDKTALYAVQWQLPDHGVVATLNLSAQTELGRLQETLGTWSIDYKQTDLEFGIERDTDLKPGVSLESVVQEDGHVGFAAALTAPYADQSGTYQATSDCPGMFQPVDQGAYQGTETRNLVFVLDKSAGGAAAPNDKIACQITVSATADYGTKQTSNSASIDVLFTLGTPRLDFEFTVNCP
jgi:hypothetical protein